MMRCGRQPDQETPESMSSGTQTVLKDEAPNRSAAMLDDDEK
jgi:hypothetical protein